MGTIQKDEVVNDVIKEHPYTLGVFHKWGIDSCCGGAKTLEEVAMAHKFDLEKLLQELSAVATSDPRS